MKCILCNSLVTKLYKEVKGVKILWCEVCGLLMTQRGKFLNKHLLYDTDKHYSRRLFAQSLHKHEKKVRYIMQFIRRNNDVFKSVLEIGGGYGLLASELAFNNVHVTMIEPYLNPYLVKGNKQVVVVKQSIKLYLNRSIKKFDLITLIDVIEHFDDPIAILKRLRVHLKTSGVICLVAPNYRSIMQYISHDWSWWMVEDHRVHLSPYTLRELVKKAGYVVLKQSTFEVFEDFIKNTEGSLRMIKNIVIRRSVRVFFYYPALLVYLLLRPLIWYFGYGGLNIILVRKK